MKMFYFIPLYFFVVLNSVESAENNEALKTENSDSLNNTYSNLSRSIDRNSSFVQHTKLVQNPLEMHTFVNTSLINDEKPLNLSSFKKTKANKMIKYNIVQTQEIVDSEGEGFVEKPPFQPSPMLGSVVEYEFNKFPVKPAYAEPRQRFSPSGNNESPWIVKDNIWKASDQVTDHKKPEAIATVEEVKPEPKSSFTTAPGTTALLGTTWNTKDHFQTVPSVDRPYQFYHQPGFTSSGPVTNYETSDFGGASVTGLGSSNYGTGHSGFGLESTQSGAGPSSYGTQENSDGFAFNKPVEVPRKANWNYYGAKTQLDCCPERKPEREKMYHERAYGGLSYYGYSPWKKVIKILSTLIPLGILISALTPSVIQITNVNDTQSATGGETFSRYRSAASNTSKKEIADHLLSSLEYIEELNQNGCEYRVFCELLLSAKNTKNSRKNVDSLLDSFSERNFDVMSKKKELEKVFDAVRNHDCKSIHCELIAK